MLRRRGTGLRWLATLLVAGCYGSSADRADGRDAAEAALDAVPDGACAAPASWSVVPVEILALGTYDDGPATEGRVVRVEARVESGVDGCRGYGGYDFEVDEGARLVRLTIFAWQLDDAPAGPCERGAAVPVVVRLPGLGAGRWTVQDGAVGPAGDPVTLELDVAPCAVDCWCSRPGAEFGQGQACTQDCQCRSGLDCLGYLAVDGELRLECQPSCTDDRDCHAPETCSVVPEGPFSVCYLMPLPCDPLGPSCPAGQVCPCSGFSCFCTAAEPVEAVECCRTADCPAGHICVADDAGVRSCGVPCRHDFNCGGVDVACPAMDRLPGVCEHREE